VSSRPMAVQSPSRQLCAVELWLGHSVDPMSGPS
jgi:hypothetical protein